MVLRNLCFFMGKFHNSVFVKDIGIVRLRKYIVAEKGIYYIEK